MREPVALPAQTAPQHVPPDARSQAVGPPFDEPGKEPKAIVPTPIELHLRARLISSSYSYRVTIWLHSSAPPTDS